MPPKLRVILLLLFTALILVVVAECTQTSKAGDVRGPLYAGSAACMQCHKSMGENYAHNAHFNTSQWTPKPSSTDSLKLPAGEFVFTPKTKVGVERRDSGLYQIAYVDGIDRKAERTDMAFGSGKKAYTFGFWYNDVLMQMPLNYLTREHQWVNSPGFPTDQIYFGRPITNRCLECHASFAQKKPQTTIGMEEEFIKGSIIAGIDCERCHGPAAQHVAYHQDHPEEKTSAHLVSFKQLSRAQRVSFCGSCHSGAGLQTANSIFYFLPGDTIKTLPDYSTYLGKDPDVHGKQNQLLEASQCFISSQMDCQTCHSMHESKPQTLAMYSQKCMSCHEEVKHVSLDKKQMAIAQSNCIDCHMPVKTSMDIGFQISNSKKKIPYDLRTHKIAVYRDVKPVKKS